MHNNAYIFTLMLKIQTLILMPTHQMFLCTELSRPVPKTFRSIFFKHPCIHSTESSSNKFILLFIENRFFSHGIPPDYSFPTLHCSQLFLTSLLPQSHSPSISSPEKSRTPRDGSQTGQNKAQ